MKPHETLPGISEHVQGARTCACVMRRTQDETNPERSMQATLARVQIELLRRIQNNDALPCMASYVPHQGFDSACNPDYRKCQQMATLEYAHHQVTNL